MADPRWEIGAWMLAGVTGAIGAMALRGGESWISGLPPCAMRQVFHIGCPTCGLTRALVRLAHRDLGGAWALHPLALPVAVAALMGWLLWGAGLVRGRPLIAAKGWMFAAAITALAAIAIWVVRLSLGTLPV